MKNVVVPVPSAPTKRPRPSRGGTDASTAAVAHAKEKPPKATAKKASPATKKASAGGATAVAVRRPKLIWRTRDQENSLLYNVQLDVASLQSELQGLRAYREMLMGRAMNRRDDLDGSFVRTVREYFRVFRHGYTCDQPKLHRGHDPSRPLLALPSDTTCVETVVSPAEFLRCAMDERVTIGRFAGLAHIMKQWERYSSVLGPLTLSFLDSQIISTFRGSGEGQDQVLVTSRARYHLYISLRTIEIMFPHVLPYQEIVTKILGRRISGVGKFDFVFNTATNRIVRYEFSLDLTQSFVDLLGNPAMVALLLDGALISDEFFIGDLSEFVPDHSEPVSVKEASQSSAEPDQAPRPAQVRPSKMTLSSILSAADDENDVAMDECEPHGEEAPTTDDTPQKLDLQRHDHAPVWLEPV